MAGSNNDKRCCLTVFLFNRRCLFLLFVVTTFFGGCGDSKGRLGRYNFKEDVTQARPAEEETETGECDGGMDQSLEELQMEDSDELAAVIREKLLSKDDETQELLSKTDNESGVPQAHLNLKLSGKECMARLREQGVAVEVPNVETPLVETPVLIKGPIGGVTVSPRWPQQKNINAIMDCHLALSLVAVAKEAQNLGIAKVLYYSIYRPLVPPKKSCEEGRRGSKCRKLKTAYEQAKKNPSQHRRGLAIDIGWLVAKDGELISVSDNFEKRSKEPPCGYSASTEKGRILSKFACRLYDKRIFNVMLTPNANKAHHNHFHFDLTPNASWYIVR